VSNSWHPDEIYSHFLTRCPFSLGGKVERFLKALLPPADATALETALKIYPFFSDEFVLSGSEAYKEVDSYIQRFNSDIDGIDTIGSFGMSHCYFFALEKLNKAISEDNKRVYFKVFANLCGGRFDSDSYHSTDYYYRQIVNCRDALLHIHEITDSRPLSSSELLEEIERTHHHYHANPEVPLCTTQFKTEALQKKLSDTVELLAGIRDLGGLVRQSTMRGKALFEDNLEDEMDAIDSDTTFSGTPFSARFTAVPPRNTRKLSTSNSQKGVNDLRELYSVQRQVNALPTLTDKAFDATVSQIAAGTDVPGLADLTKRKPQLIGASTYAVRRDVINWQNAAGKQNNPSLTARNMHSPSLIGDWLEAIYPGDPTLASLCLLLVLSGITDKRLNTLIKPKNANYDLQFNPERQQLTYTVLNHGHAKVSKQPQIMTLTLPAFIVEALVTFKAAGEPLRKRYKKVRRTLLKTGVQITPYLAQWAGSHAILMGSYLRPYDQGILSGTVRFAYFSESYYTQTDLTRLNTQFKTALEDILASMSETSRAISSLDRSYIANATLGSIGPDVTIQAARFDTVLQRISDARLALARNITTDEGTDLQLLIGLANLINLNLAMIILIIAVARPHWNRMVLIELLTGLHVEDKDSADHREPRLIQPFNRVDWQNGRTLLHEQLNEAIAIHKYVHSAAKASRIPCEDRPSSRKNRFLPVVYTLNLTTFRCDVEPIDNPSITKLLSTLLKISEDAHPVLNHMRQACASARPEHLSDEDRTHCAMHFDLHQQRNDIGHHQPGLGLTIEESSRPMNTAKGSGVVAYLLSRYKPKVITIPKKMRGWNR
jgi:hypothetical protein